MARQHQVLAAPWVGVEALSDGSRDDVGHIGQARLYIFVRSRKAAFLTLLLASTALIAVPVIAWAGGAGGAGKISGGQGGAAGSAAPTDFNHPNVGAAGAAGSPTGGAGGNGGAGLGALGAGGGGGGGDGQGTGGAGGAGGTGGDADVGFTVSGNGGGGGGDGGNGIGISSTLTNAGTAYTGGAGGDGGGGGVGSFAFANQHPAGAGGGGGGGGAGGNGIVFSGTAASLTNGGLVTGGRGGNGGNGGIGGVGAAGGPTFNDGPTGGAGGPAGAGGAGGVGIAITGIGVTLTNTSTIKGGAGGNGGNGGNGSTGSSGGDGIDPGSNGYNGGNGGVGGAGNGGGAGGIAITVSGVGATLNNSGTITGGNGGAGGNGGNGGSGGPGGAAGGNASAGTAGTTGAGGAGGAGGNAGAAVVFSAGGSLINSGTISIGSAGSGGAGGTGSAFGGNGAAGSGNVVAVSGANLSIVNSGSITGGSTAITFTSGTNLLELDAGSTINGLVQANGSADTLRLGGGTNFSFDMSTILSQYQGFEALAKSGSGTVTLTGVGGGNAPWTISSGVLVFSSGLMLGGGAVTLDGGTLRAGANIPNLSNAIKVNTTGGAIDAGGNNVTLAGGITHGNGANGTLTFTNSSATSGVVNLSAASTYAGATVVGDGTHVAVLQSVGANIFSPNSAVTVNANSVLSLNNNQSIASLAGTGQVLGTGAGTTPTLTTGGNNSSTTFSGVIGNGGSATLSLTKAGTGTMTLSGTNSYTGATTISAGTLALSGAGGIAASSGVADNGTFDISATTAGASLASLTGNGGVTLGGKTLTLTSAGGTYSGNIGGTGGVSVTGGTLGLTGTNSYTGATIIGSGGALTLASTNAVAASSGVQADGVVSTITAGSANFNIKSLSGSGFLQFIATSPQTLTLTNAGGTFSGVISVLNALPSTYGALVITGGTQTLTGANTYGGGTTITGGTIVAGNNSALGTGAVTLDGGTLKAGGNFTLSNAITINTTAGTIDTGGGNTLILNGAITNGNGAGTLTIANSGGGTGLVFLNSSGNTYSGATVIGDGTSAVVFDNAGGAFSPNSAVTVNGNSVLLLTSSQTVASLAGAGTVRASAAATLTTGGDNSSTLFSGTIIDSIGMVALTKTGTGTLTLSGVNTYTDNTTISAGTLALSASGSIAASRSVSGAGTLDISATNAGASIIALTGNTTVNLGARTLTITNGQSADYSGNIRGTGGVSITGGILQMTGTTEYTGVTIVGSGAQLAMASSGIEASSNLQLDGNLQVTDLYGTSNFRIHSISGAGSILFSPVSSGMVTLTLTNASGTFSGTMGGAAQAFDLKSALVITGGHETLSGGNSYGGGTTISGGATLSANHLDVDSTIDALGTGTITLAGGTLETLVGGPLYQGITVTADSTIAAASGKTLTLASAPGSLTVGNATLSFGSASDTGTVILSPTSATVASSAAIAVTGGTLKLGNAAGAGAVVAAGGLTVGTGVTPATFDLGGQNVTLGGLAGNAQGIVTDSGSAVTLTVNNAVASGFAGVIKDGAGAISFTKTGTGTLILAGANAYGGTTTISGGTLQIGNGSASGALGTGNVVNNAILAFNRSDAWQYAGTISGSGAVNVLAGNLVLTAANSYAGGTSIASGATLQLGIPTANGSIAGNVADAGTLAFNNGSSQTYAGIISGSGQVTKAAAGTLILTGANSYGGGTTITFGTLQVGAGGTVGSLGSGAIADNGALVFNRSDSITLANTLAGNGTFTQAGGTIIYDGNGGGFTGTTTVNGGTLEVGDTATPGAVLGGTVNVASGATLMGHGTVGSTALASGATLAPGGSIGTLTVNGSLTLASGSTLAMEISPTAADKVVVNGNATLGGVLAVTQSGSVPAADYKLITASSTSGTFSSITGISFAGLNSTLQYSATGADLILSNPVVARPPTITYLFQSYGKTPNQVAAGTALYAGASTGTLYTAAGALVTSGPVAAANTLEQLAGDIHASVRAAAIEDSRLIRNAMLDQLGRTGEGANVWINGFGDYGGVASDGNASALHHTVSGVAGGVDMIAAPGLRIGLGGAFSANDAGSEARQSNASGHMAHILGYAGYSIDALDLRIGGDYGSGTLDTSRALAAFGQALTSRRDQSLTQAFGEAGWRLTGDFAMAEPYAGIAHVAANDGAFAETGGSAALSGASRTDQVTYAMLGVKGSLARIDLGGAVLTPTADIAWNHAFNRFLPGQLLTYQDAATSFTALGTPLAQDSAAIQLGADLAIGDNAMLSLGYDGKLSSSTDSHGVRGGLSWTF